MVQIWYIVQYRHRSFDFARVAKKFLSQRPIAIPGQCQVVQWADRGGTEILAALSEVVDPKGEPWKLRR